MGSVIHWPHYRVYMSFVDLRFLVFFPTVVTLYLLLPERFRWMMLLAASYLFYMAWRPEYGLLLLSITAIDFVAGRYISRAQDPTRRKLFLVVSLAANLGILFYFKYVDFVLTSLSDVLRFAGSDVTFSALDVLLPIGISFHIFQSMSYTIDIYRKKVEPVTHFGKFALYVSFFPQLVAGPIERPSGLLKQIVEGAQFDIDKARSGTKLMAWGFFKKLVIADNLAPFVNAAFANPDSFSGPTLAFAVVLFAYQIYCDFSGYTDIARGAARIFGYELMLNFNRPFHATSLTDFWNRWHISLSSWLREYLYYPLVMRGRQRSKGRIYISAFITLVLIGLWHGADWTYIIFGAIHGIYLVIGTATLAARTSMYRTLWKPFGMTAPPAFLKTLTVFAMVCFSYVFFRAASLDDALYMITRLGHDWSGFLASMQSLSGAAHALAMDLSPRGLIVALVALLFMELVEAPRSLPARAVARVPRHWRLAGYALGACMILAFGVFDSGQQFIYFQF